MIDLDELTRNSLAAAYKDQISLLFQRLVANLSDGRSGDASGLEFSRGLRIAKDAYAKAESLVG